MKRIVITAVMILAAMFVLGQNIVVNRIKVDTIKSRSTNWVYCYDSLRVRGALSLPAIANGYPLVLKSGKVPDDII